MIWFGNGESSRTIKILPSTPANPNRTIAKLSSSWNTDCMESNANQQVTPTETPSQSVQHPINNQRGNFLIILGVLILLLVFGSGAYFLVANKNITSQMPQPIVIQPTAIPTTDPTANWQTYTNQNQTIDTSNWKTFTSATNLYTVKAPSNWERPPAEADLYIQPKGSPTQAIIIRPQKKGVSAIDQEYADIQSKPDTKQITVDGHKAYLAYQPGQCTSEPNVYIEYNSAIYKINQYRCGDKEAMKTLETENVFGQILSTFKFTN